jgi:hypothetical protein
MGLIAYQISKMEQAQLEFGIRQAPYYQEHMRRIVEHTIRAIHAITDLFVGRYRDEVQVYLGRSTDSAEGIAGRWRSHRASKDHLYAAVLCRVPTDMVIRVERVATRVLGGLDERGKLCIANATADGRGPLPSSYDATIYMTWCFQRPRVIEKATMEDVREIAREVAETEDVARASLEGGLLVMRRPSDFAEMDWHPDHT